MVLHFYFMYQGSKCNKGDNSQITPCVIQYAGIIVDTNNQ